MARLLYLITIMFFFYYLNQAASVKYNIKPNSADLCNQPGCLTLSQFITNISRLPNSKSTTINLVFSPGIHYLNENLTMSTSGNFTMTFQNQTAEIRCARYSQVVLNGFLNVDITNLEFFGCGARHSVVES